MVERAKRFLEDLDRAYSREDVGQWDDYCVCCCVPGSRYFTVHRNWRWLSSQDFDPKLKFQELLRKHRIPLGEFFAAWAAVYRPMVLKIKDEYQQPLHIYNVMVYYFTSYCLAGLVASVSKSPYKINPAL